MALPRRTAENNLLAIAAMVVACFFYLLGDSLVKLTSEQLPVPQIIFVRGLMTTVLVAGAVAASGALAGWRHAFDRPVLARSAFDAVTTLLIVNALAHMAIADATAVINSVPIVATFLAVVILREHVGIRRWAAVFAGFAGVLLVLRPSGADFNEYGLLALAATLTISGREIVTRRIADEVPSLVVTLAAVIVVTLAGAAAVAVTRVWVTLDGRSLAMLALASVMLFGAYHYSVVAIRLGEISLSAPFRYTVIVWGLVAGYVIWGDVPSLTALAGMGLITLAGLYVIHREHRMRRRGRG